MDFQELVIQFLDLELGSIIGDWTYLGNGILEELKKNNDSTYSKISKHLLKKNNTVFHWNQGFVYDSPY